jgi:hypothetical protein
MLRAQLLQVLYTVSCERLLMEGMDYNLLFRWFVGLNADDEVAHGLQRKQGAMVSAKGALFCFRQRLSAAFTSRRQGRVRRIGSTSNP